MTPFFWSFRSEPLFYILAEAHRRSLILLPHEPLKAKRPPAPKPSRHRTYNWH